MSLLGEVAEFLRWKGEEVKSVGSRWFERGNGTVG